MTSALHPHAPSLRHSRAHAGHKLRSSSVKRVLVTDGDERSALAIVRSLGRAGYEVHVCSRAGRSLAGASRYAKSDVCIVDQLMRPDEFARELADHCKRIGIEALLPVGEASLLAVLANQESFERILVPFASEDQFRRVCDKAQVLKAARDVGIAVPAQHLLRERAELSTIIDSGSLRFPVVVKPSRSVVGDTTSRKKVGVSYAATAEELVRRVDSYGDAAFPLLLQQRVVGPAVGIFVLRWDGEILGAFSHRRLREKPPSGGISVYSESVSLDPLLLAQSQALLECFDWRGVAMVEFKVDEATNVPYLMEINGRFWGSLQLAVTAGMDFPAMLLAAATNRLGTRMLDYQVGVRNRWWWGEVDHLLARLRRSNEELSLPPGAPTRMRAVFDFLRWTRNDRNETLRLSDIRPFLRESKLWLQGR